MFDPEELTDQDQIGYLLHTAADEIREDDRVMNQENNNSEDQAMPGDFPKAVDDAILASGDAHQNQMMQLLSDPAKAKLFSRLLVQPVSHGAVNTER